jgi:hypothetical protein
MMPCDPSVSSGEVDLLVADQIAVDAVTSPVAEPIKSHSRPGVGQLLAGG